MNQGATASGARMRRTEFVAETRVFHKMSVIPAPVRPRLILGRRKNPSSSP
jgi:hypothetical protein